MPVPGAIRDPLLTVRSGRDAETYVVALYGELDLGSVDQLEKALAVAEASDASEVVVDLSGLHFIDSSGINALWQAAKRCPRLALLRPSAPVNRIFELCGVAAGLPFLD